MVSFSLRGGGKREERVKWVQKAILHSQKGTFMVRIRLGALIKTVLVLAFGVVSFAGAVAAQESESPTFKMSPASAAVRKAAVASVLAQLKAFARDDYAKAVQYQSANLKQNFPSVAAFKQMMTSAYPEFAHYKSAQFGDAQADTGGVHVLLPVTLTGQDGIVVKAMYILVREGRIYKVDGVAGGERAPLPLNPDASVDV